MSKRGCDCGSGIETSVHYYAGICIGWDCPKCWQKNDDARCKELMSPEERKRWRKKLTRRCDIK